MTSGGSDDTWSPADSGTSTSEAGSRQQSGRQSAEPATTGSPRPGAGPNNPYGYGGYPQSPNTGGFPAQQPNTGGFRAQPAGGQRPGATGAFGAGGFQSGAPRGASPFGGTTSYGTGSFPAVSPQGPTPPQGPPPGQVGPPSQPPAGGSGGSGKGRNWPLLLVAA
ncbi:MAG: hypothetical protein QM658_06480, partial [Gordonia sp. (in: high G+C Gram-positive bacteria)]